MLQTWTQHEEYRYFTFIIDYTYCALCTNLFYCNKAHLSAGAGMARGFHVIIGVGSGIIFGIIFYVIIILLSPVALYIALGFYVLIGLYSIYFTYYCYTSGGEFQYSAML